MRSPGIPTNHILRCKILYCSVLCKIKFKLSTFIYRYEKLLTLLPEDIENRCPYDIIMKKLEDTGVGMVQRMRPATHTSFLTVLQGNNNNTTRYDSV